MINWIFFDIDDTLWDFSANSLASLRLLFKESEILKSVFPDFDSFSDLYHHHNSLLWHQYHHGEISTEYLKAERFRRTVFPESTDTDRQAFEKSMALNDRYLEILAQQPLVTPHALEVLEMLKGEYMLAALSNGFLDTQYKKVNLTGLNRYLTRIVISEEVDFRKPDPRLFQFALDATGASADRAIMVGDNPDADIQGALDSGWKAVYYDRSGNPDSEIAKELSAKGVPVISDLAQLPAVLDKIKLNSLK